jgi:hypothetical protein
MDRATYLLTAWKVAWLFKKVPNESFEQNVGTWTQLQPLSALGTLCIVDDYVNLIKLAHL